MRRSWRRELGGIERLPASVDIDAASATASATPQLSDFIDEDDLLLESDNEDPEKRAKRK